MRLRVGLVRFCAGFCSLALLAGAPALASAAQPKSSFKAPVAKTKSVRAPRTPVAKYHGPIYSAIILDANTGQVLNEINSDTQSYPASLTKMMTLYMLFEALEKGQVTMDTPMPVSRHASMAAPSKLGLRPKMKISVEQAIQALITKSANDVAVVTGEYLAGGSEDKFAEMMTFRARMLGMKQTAFRNASGLPDPGQLSSARDMATLASHLIKDFPQYYPQFSRMEFAFQGQTIRTHNHLLEFYEGADGIKTGYTAASGFNLVASATRNGYRLIGVLFGGETASQRDKKLAGMMDDGFAVLSGTPGTLIADANKNGAATDRIAAQINQTQVAALQVKEPADKEEGDADDTFKSVTKTGPIVTSALPPMAAAPVTEAPVAARTQGNTRTTTLAALTPAAPRAPVPNGAVAAAQALTTFGVQIGAFSNRATAEAQATTAAMKLKSTFSTAAATVLPVKSGDKVIYRARVVGLTQPDLIKACGIIGKQIKGACQAIGPDSTVAAR